MNFNFTGKNFYKQQKKNNILPPHQIEALRSSSAYHNRFIKTLKAPKIYNANSFAMKQNNDFIPKFIKYKSNNNLDLVNNLFIKEKIHDENLKLKVELNKRSKDYSQMRVECSKLEVKAK